MGEKGNLLDTGEAIFANLAEQGPQFWLDYEQYKLSRGQSIQTRVNVAQRATAAAEGNVAEGNTAAQGWRAERPTPPAAE